MNKTDVSTMAPAVPVKESDRAGTRGVAIAMFCVLLTSYVLMAADRYLLSVLAPDVRRYFGFSLANTGLLTTIFTLGLGIGGLPTGYLLSRFSRKMVLLTGIAIFSTATVLTVRATGLGSMVVLLAVQGIGMAMLATSMFALAASYFVKNRAAAIGSVNFCYGIGGFIGPNLAGYLLTRYMNWKVPMAAFGLFGYFMIGLIIVSVRPWFSETKRAATARADAMGAPTLANRNTVILTILSIIHGLSMYGFLGLYPTFLREILHYTPSAAGAVMGFFGIGALASIGGGWIGDRFSPRVVLSAAYVGIAVLGYLFFQESASHLTRQILTCIYGVVGSAVLYVNLAGYHVKSLRGTLASRGSGMFVTTLYGAAAFSGYIMGAIASRAGWMMAAEIQMTLLSIVGAVLALALRPSEMAL
jgi:DHA1 family inner membrane transport protein